MVIRLAAALSGVIRHLGRCFLCMIVIEIGAHAQSLTLKVEHDLTIPNPFTPWAVDNYENHPQLVPIHHSNVIVNRHGGRNFVGLMVVGPLYSQKLTTEIDGTHARVQLHTKTPIFYLLADNDPTSSTKDTEAYTFAIVHVTSVKDKRVVDALSYDTLGYDLKRNGRFIATFSSTPADGWIRIVPKEAMSEGEYCLLPIPKAKGAYAIQVYDFAIDLAAPDEKDAIVASQP